MNKFSKAIELLKNHYIDNIHINLSPVYGYRSRVEFGYKNNFYTMFDENGNIKFISNLRIARPSVQLLMPILLKKINSNKLLKTKLFQINFRCNNQNHILVSLVYHKKLCSKIENQALKLSKVLKIDINLRSKNKFFSTCDGMLDDYIESLGVRLYQTDQSFYQPNHYHMPKMINKTISLLGKTDDLLELYCGSGTFTLPLSKYFDHVFATENNRQSIKCLSRSIEESNIKNISYSRLSAEEVAEAFEGRLFRRMNYKTIKDYNFSHVLVDPPRSGLTANVIDIIKKFNNIIYISCDYITYERDIKLLKNFKIKEIEIFDQFPNTRHLEIVSLLTYKKNI
jgi:tRNA (uracil-5-)-methyltransferase